MTVSCGRVLQPVSVGNKTLADYTHICGPELINEIRELAEPCRESASCTSRRQRSAAGSSNTYSSR